jgi:predicted DNA-binding transcriptional regulator AlpA
VAKLIGCHPKTVDRWLKVSAASANPFPAFDWIGSRRCWIRSEVEQWLAVEKSRPLTERHSNLPPRRPAATVAP